MSKLNMVGKCNYDTIAVQWLHIERRIQFIATRKFVLLYELMKLQAISQKISIEYEDNEITLHHAFNYWNQDFMVSIVTCLSMKMLPW